MMDLSRCACCVLHEVLPPENVEPLAASVRQIPMTYSLNDVHSVRQTVNLTDTKNLAGPLNDFIKSIKTSLKKYAEQLFNVTLNNKFTITGSLFGKGDYLLCHDDMYDDRVIAFVYYLTDPGWTADDGGELRFFDHDEEELPVTDCYRGTLLPTRNSLVLFKVSKTSFHEVQQVFSDKPRLSINGWFHGPDSPNLVAAENNVAPNPHLRSPIIQLSEYLYNKPDWPLSINNQYAVMSSLSALQLDFLENGVTLLGKVLNNKFQQLLLEEVENAKSWEFANSPLHRRYQSIPMKEKDNELQIPEVLPHTRNLLSFLTSEVWLTLVSYITGHDFTVINDELKPPVFCAELQKWTEGCYSTVTDDDFLRTFNPDFSVIELVLVIHAESLGQCDIGDEQTSGRFNIVTNTKSKEINTNVAEGVERKGGMTTHRTQLSRLDTKVLFEQKKKRHINNHSPQFKKRFKKKRFMRKVQKVVKHKLARIVEFRKALFPKIKYITPQTNTLFLAECDATCAMFMSYLPMKEPHCTSPLPAYYCLSVRYLTSRDCTN